MSERLTIVKTAVAIIKEDIQAKVYETKSYLAFEDMKDGVTGLIPDTLKLFMKYVTSEKNKLQMKETQANYY